MQRPSMDEWIKEAKQDISADKCGMYLFHNGVVRSTPKAAVRALGGPDARGTVEGMFFSYDRDKVDAAVKEALQLPGIYYVRIWLNDGLLKTGDDIMLVLVGGDIRPHVVDGLGKLVGTIKNYCVTEKELIAGS